MFIDQPNPILLYILSNIDNKFYKMIQQGNRTQKLIYRTSYRKHRERLADIRHNITGNEFMPQHKQPQSHKKYNYKDKLRKDEIETENSVLKNKIGYIKNRGSHKIEELFSTEPIRKETKRYFQQKGEKLKIDSDLNEGEQVKIVFPSKRIASFAEHVVQKQPEKSIGNCNEAKQTVLPSSKKRFSSYSVIKERQRNKNQGKQKIFDYPERNQNRVVVFKKTIILGNMQSCLLQLSFLEDRLLVAAYLMGLQNGTLRQLFNAQRSQQMMKQCDKDYAQLCERIKIQKIKDQFQIIRILPKLNKEQDNSIIKNINQQQESKQKLKLQNDFLKRNYYTINKAQVNEKIEEIKQKVGNANNQYIQSIVQRLALPKRFYKFRQQKTDKTQRVNKLNSSVNDKQSKINSSSNQQIQSQLNLSKKEALHKENRYENKQLPLKHQQINTKSKQSVKINNKSIVQSQKKQQYQQLFENNSSVFTNKNPSLPKNNSEIASKKQQLNKPKQQQAKKTEKLNESNVYQQQFQHQQGNEQQKYEQSFEKSHQMSPIAKIQQPSKKAPQEVAQDQYHDQFQS